MQYIANKIKSLGNFLQNKTIQRLIASSFFFVQNSTKVDKGV